MPSTGHTEHFPVEQNHSNTRNASLSGVMDFTRVERNTDHLADSMVVGRSGVSSLVCLVCKCPHVAGA